ncbi:Crp/Fnr family transcriptional regulator [Thioclava sp. JE_KL1]|uniref:Crp/Fnr family transcriptional regulator n=1 Tax=Thioclava sp. JE_KL1 TaxID=2651187 RepID=UPI00128DF4CA|nr:Crp/Fnr family transcriptional regulator [Thioclava sp. JE_KL1]MPQ95823.1 Crp/Fnr family transcriptional regulator [Thioclava sp. JE_KL1]
MVLYSQLTCAPSSTCLQFVEDGIGFFGEIDACAAKALATRTHVARFPSGTTIFAQGEPATWIGILCSGAVKVVNQTEDGEMHILSLLSTGDIVGDIGATENRLAWEAATDVTLCWMTRSSFETLLSEHEALRKGYLAATIHQLEKERLWMSSLRSKGTTQRIAALLFAQLPPQSGTTETHLSISLTRRDIASLLDMSSETLCRALNKIRGIGAIRMPTPALIVVQQPGTLLAIAKGVEPPLPNDMMNYGMRNQPKLNDSFPITAHTPRRMKSVMIKAIEDEIGFLLPIGRP